MSKVVQKWVVRCLFLPFVGNLFFISTFFKIKRQSFSFSVQNVEAEDGNDNWDDGWYGGRVSSSVVVNEKDLGTDIHDAKRREPRCSFSVLMCERVGIWLVSLQNLTIPEEIRHNHKLENTI